RARRPGVAHLRAGVHERSHPAGLSAGHPSRRARAPAGGLAGPCDVVHAGVPRRRVAALRPVLAVGVRRPGAVPGQDLQSVRRDGRCRHAGGSDSLPEQPPAVGPVSGPRVGVLALQGDVREHLAALGDAGADAVSVRRSGELDTVDGLVIPGGESTTMSHPLRELDLLEPLRARLADGLPAYGACAGMILLASEILDAGTAGREALPLSGIDITVRRN